MTAVVPNHHSHSQPHPTSAAALLDRMASRQAARDRKTRWNPSTHAVPAVPMAEPAQPDWDGYTCEFLITRVLRRQHTEIREELLRLSELARAASEPTSSLATGLATMAADLTAGIAAEEKIFSNLLELELAYVGLDHASGAPQRVHSSLDRAAHQHHRHDQQLRQLRTEAARLSAADRELMERLVRFQRTLAEHFHVEERVLLPRARRMEKELFC